MGIVQGAKDSKDAGSPCLQKCLWSEHRALQVNTPRSVLHNREKCPGCQENRGARVVRKSFKGGDFGSILCSLSLIPFRLRAWGGRSFPSRALRAQPWPQHAGDPEPKDPAEPARTPLAAVALSPYICKGNRESSLFGPPWGRRAQALAGPRRGV